LILSEKYQITLSQEQKDRILLLVNKELSFLEDLRYRHQIVIDLNSDNLPLADENKEEKRKVLLEDQKKVVAIYTKDITDLEIIQKELNNNES
jgi:hypothetical protein